MSEFKEKYDKFFNDMDKEVDEVVTGAKKLIKAVISNVSETQQTNQKEKGNETEKETEKKE